MVSCGALCWDGVAWTRAGLVVLISFGLILRGSGFGFYILLAQIFCCLGVLAGLGSSGLLF